MEKLFGFMLFFIGIGMIIGMLIAENVVLVVSAGVFLLLSQRYNKEMKINAE